MTALAEMDVQGAHCVDFRAVWLAYHDELEATNEFAVEDISLTTREGECIAIVGPSGCGKSTFMKPGLRPEVPDP